MTDETLINRFLGGDIQAFNTLVWQWQDRIYNFALRYLAREDDAKDITQRTFIKVYKGLHRLKDQRKFSSWIYQIALNLCHDETKRRRRRTVLSLQALNENHNHHLSEEILSPAQRDGDPATRAETLDFRELLQRALDEIPPEQKTVVIMKELQGLKFNEIAEILDISVNTAKSRMYYGLHALKKVFDQWEIDKEAVSYEM